MNETKCLICGHLACLICGRLAQFPWAKEPTAMTEIILKLEPYGTSIRLAVHNCCLAGALNVGLGDRLAAAAGLKEEEL